MSKYLLVILIWPKRKTNKCLWSSGGTDRYRFGFYALLCKQEAHNRRL